MIRIILSAFICWAIIFIPNHAVGYDERTTHREITEKAVKDISGLGNYLMTSFGFQEGTNTRFPSNSQDPKRSVLELLKKGSTDEDAPICRGTNHFHNPLKSWDRAGISTIWWPLCPTWDVTSNLTRHSALTWATGYNSYNGSIINRSHQQMGWDKSREYFYAALTSNDKTMREDYFAKTFQSVGQVMHPDRIMGQYYNEEAA